MPAPLQLAESLDAPFTYQMSGLRRAGVLQYSRRFIDVNVPSPREVLHDQGIELPSTEFVPLPAF
jgi:hypothetical protein